MIHPIQATRRLIDSARLQIRRGKRSGSVLILVVALLVLMALIGTAFITTTGADRDSAVQNGYNTQVELLVQGVKDMVIAALVSTIAPSDPPQAGGKPGFRPAEPATPTVADPTTFAWNKVPANYTNLDYSPWDGILADRTPNPISPSNQTRPTWTYISASPLAATRDPNNPAIYPNQFRSPYVNGSANPGTYSTRRGLMPDYLTITSASGVTRDYPAFKIDEPGDNQNGKVVLAGDASGSGIPDAGLFELPVGQINGLKYFAAIRVVDNCAAINASTAWENWQFRNANDNNLPMDITPANIDMTRLFAADTTAKFDQFNTYRFNGAATPNLNAIRDDGQASLFKFATRYDAFWTMLGSRLDNPGKVSPTASYRALGVSETAAMAYHGGMANLLGSSSVLETYFPGSTRMNSVNRPSYLAKDYGLWFQNIYDYDNLDSSTAARVPPARPIVVSVNPVSNMIPAFSGDPNTTLDEQQRLSQYRYRGNWQPAGMLYHIGEWVRYTPVNGLPRGYVCISNHVSAPTSSPVPNTPVEIGRQLWAELPWYNHPVKINPNTANFGQLMAAYYAVMGDGPEIKPSGTQDPAYGAYPVWTFGEVARPLAGSGISVPMTPRKVKQLRAAIAAVNTIENRDADDDVTSRTVKLTDDQGGNETTVQVYGTEKQPYITEAVAHFTATEIPYVIIELYNPYPVDMPLVAFALAYRPRSGNGQTFTDIDNNVLKANSIPAHGYLYLENDTSRRPPDIAAIMGTIPAGKILTMAALEDVVIKNGGNNEVMLLRTRQFLGGPTSSTDPANTFNEQNRNYVDWIPADQLEFTGIATGLGDNTITLPDMNTIVMPDPTFPPADGPPVTRVYVPMRYHYRRATANGPVPTNRWHCVYGGPYNRDATVADRGRRQRGWVLDKKPTATLTTITENLTLPGFGDKMQGPDGILQKDGVYDPRVSTYHTRSLQVNNVGFGGPWKPIAASAASTFQSPNGTLFPFGGFARTGDLLQVTFCGAYRLDGGYAEMNSISMDSAFAEDGDKADDDPSNGAGLKLPVEQLGRFCPFVAQGIDDLALRPNPFTPVPTHRYAWAADLFDYFSVISPQDDYLPNVDPGYYINQQNQAISGDPTVIGSANKFPQFPQDVANGLAVTDYKVANHGREDVAAVHGLINLNTASWKVISAIPFTSNKATNIQIARDIVKYRDNIAPLRNLFDLLKVPGFTTTDSANPMNVDGDITPLTINLAPGVQGIGADDGVFGDFEARYLMITRISNMVTFRSDSFTVYVLVQGWRNAGTSSPELVVQRRAAMIVDRSTVRPNLPTGTWTGDLQVTSPSITNVPQN